MRLVFLLALVAPIAGAGTAQARPEPVYDLAGLVLQSEAVVVADRVENIGDHTWFRVVRVLRASRPVPPQVGVVTLGYHAERTDARAVLFLAWDGNAPRLVPSGLRVTRNGEVFRFQQKQDPGGYEMVAQVRADTSTMDVPALVRAIARAARRVDALALAAADPQAPRRRAAILELLRRDFGEGGWNFVDVFGRRAAALLRARGDFEGALLAEHRIGEPAATADLPRVRKLATHTRQSIELRLAAIETIGASADDPLGAADLLELVDDPDPQIRIAAIHACKDSPEARARLLERFRTATHPRTLAALARVLAEWNVTLPRRARLPAALVDVELAGPFVALAGVCLERSSPVRLKIVARRATYGAIATEQPIACERGEAFVTDHVAFALLPGSYELSLTIGGTPWPLGTLDVDARGDRTLR